MYCNHIPHVYSVYTVCIQPSYSCKEVVDTTTYSYSQLIIQVAQSYAILQLSCNFKNTVNTAEFRIHTIILQLHTQLTPLIYNHITLYIQCNYRVRVYSIHTSSVVTLSYSILTTLLQMYCNIVAITHC